MMEVAMKVVRKHAMDLEHQMSLSGDSKSPDTMPGSPLINKNESKHAKAAASGSKAAHLDLAAQACASKTLASDSNGNE